MTNKLSFTVLLLNGVFFLNGMAHNCPVPGPVMVSEVTFSQGTPLTNDYVDAQGVPVPMVGSHWVDQVNNANSAIDFPDGHPDEVAGVAKPNNVKSYAYSYVSNKSPKVGAVFKWLGAVPALPEGKHYWAEGVVINTPNCEFTLPLRELAGDTIYPAAVSDQTIVLGGPNRKIQAYVTPNRKVDRKDAAGKNYADSLVPVTIEWTVYKIGKEPGNIVGKSCSTHTIYVTWDEPSTTLRQETLFNLACVMAKDKPANNSTEEELVYKTIFSDFEDLTVLRMDGTSLTYYKDPKVAAPAGASPVQMTGSLLNNGDSQCDPWATFLIDCGRAHRINSQMKQVQPKLSLSGQKKYMAINNWNFVNQGTLAANPPGGVYTHINILFATGDYKDQSWYYDEVKDQPGVSGQGNVTNPLSLFENHKLVMAFNKYYDPSYGKIYDDIIDKAGSGSSFEKDSVNSFSEYPGILLTLIESDFNKDVNGNGDTEDEIENYPAFMFRKNNFDPANTDLSELNFPY